MPRRSKLQEMASMPDTAETEYLRGKIQERTMRGLHTHAPAKFDERGNDVWAERSGRHYYEGDVAPPEGGADFASPVTGSSKPRGMGRLRALLGTRRSASPPSPKGGRLRHRTAVRHEAHPAHGGASADYSTLELLNRSVGGRATGASRPVGAGHSTGGKTTGGRPTGAASGKRAARGALVSKLMRERGVSLGEASRIIKDEGLM